MGVQLDQRSIPELIRDLIADVRMLLRQEVTLARAEIRQEIARIIMAMLLLTVAAGTLAIAGVWLLIAMTRGLAYMFAWPLAVVYAGVGAGLAVIGFVMMAIVWRQLRTLELLP